MAPRRRTARAPAAPGVSEADATLVGADWLEALEKQTTTLVDVFSAPEAWTGMTALGSAQLPAAVVGEMVLGEFVLHGWDLAVASGQTLSCPPATAQAVRAAAVAMGEQARSMGVYGPVVEVPADAPPLDLALAAIGRDPAWRP